MYRLRLSRIAVPKAVPIRCGMPFRDGIPGRGKDAARSVLFFCPEKRDRRGFFGRLAPRPKRQNLRKKVDAVKTTVKTGRMDIQVTGNRVTARGGLTPTAGFIIEDHLRALAEKAEGNIEVDLSEATNLFPDMIMSLIVIHNRMRLIKSAWLILVNPPQWLYTMLKEWGIHETLAIRRTIGGVVDEPDAFRGPEAAR